MAGDLKSCPTYGIWSGYGPGFRTLDNSVHDNHHISHRPILIRGYEYPSELYPMKRCFIDPIHLETAANASALTSRILYDPAQQQY
eukprot:6200419-Pleurochrysis_carterae.AAC.1